MLRNKIQATIDTINSGISSSFHLEANNVLACAESVLKELINSDKEDDSLLTEYNHLVTGLICLAQIADHVADSSMFVNVEDQLPGFNIIYRVLNRYGVDPIRYIPALERQADSKQLHECMVEVGKALDANHLVPSYSFPSSLSWKFFRAGVSMSQLTISPMFYNVERAVSNAATSAFGFFTTDKPKEENAPLLPPFLEQVGSAQGEIVMTPVSDDAMEGLVTTHISLKS